MKPEEVVKPEHEIDLTELPEVKHNWIKRGIKLSCEGAGHPTHSHFIIGAVK